MSGIGAGTIDRKTIALKKLPTYLLLVVLLCLPAWHVSCGASPRHDTHHKHTAERARPDAEHIAVSAEGDTVILAVAPDERHGRLTDEDFREVAEELGVEVAAIKAVTEIEAGKTHQGFWAEGKPVINFDLTMFRRMARRNGVALGKYSRSHAVVFARPNTARYGSQQAAQQARLDAARSIHNTSAIQGTFWGMFQIGGFNWKKCGAKSIDEFVELMCRSERDQLEMFATFIRNAGLLDALRKRNWSAFARGYNGPGYASRRYHTRMASAYAKYKKAEQTQTSDNENTK